MHERGDASEFGEATQRTIPIDVNRSDVAAGAPVGECVCEHTRELVE